jgi:hypothetical protein
VPTIQEAKDFEASLKPWLFQRLLKHESKLNFFAIKKQKQHRH